MTSVPLPRRGYLGLQIDLDEPAGAPPRLVVSAVDEDSPASRGGVREGDVLIAIDESTVRDLEAVVERFPGAAATGTTRSRSPRFAKSSAR